MQRRPGRQEQPELRHPGSPAHREHRVQQAPTEHRARPGPQVHRGQPGRQAHREHRVQPGRQAHRERPGRQAHRGRPERQALTEHPGLRVHQVRPEPQVPTERPVLPEPQVPTGLPEQKVRPAQPGHRERPVRSASSGRPAQPVPELPPWSSPPRCRHRSCPVQPGPPEQPEQQRPVQREWRASPGPTARPAHQAPGRQVAPASSAGPVCRRWTLCSLLLLSLVNSAGELWNRRGQVVSADTVVRHEDHSVRHVRGSHDSRPTRVFPLDGPSGSRRTSVFRPGHDRGAVHIHGTPFGTKARDPVPGTDDGIHVTWTSSETITTSGDRIADMCPVSRKTVESPPVVTVRAHAGAGRRRPRRAHCAPGPSRRSPRSTPRVPRPWARSWG